MVLIGAVDAQRKKLQQYSKRQISQLFRYTNLNNLGHKCMYPHFVVHIQAC
jgi:hypothetical protein